MTMLEIIGGILAIIATLLSGIWWLFNSVFKLGQFKEHFESFEKNTENNFNRLEKKLGNIDDTVTSHTYTLMSICSFLDNKFPKNKINSYMKKSPRQLTATGEKMLDMVNGRQFLNDNKEQLFQIIDRYHPKTKLDVQNISMTALLYYTTTDAFNNIKDIIYDMPEMETDEGKYEVTLNDICFVMSLPLRDMYITEHNMK